MKNIDTFPLKPKHVSTVLDISSAAVVGDMWQTNAQRVGSTSNGHNMGYSDAICNLCLLFFAFL
jgi:hypothetical protein